MKVYRVEDAEGFGPYRQNPKMPLHLRSQLATELEYTQQSKSHPSMWVDAPRPQNPESFICGFKSMDDLLQWFYDGIEILHKFNFFISVYESDCVLIGQFQVVFIRGKLISREAI
jgi:hypothetical protein